MLYLSILNFALLALEFMYIFPCNFIVSLAKKLAETTLLWTNTGNTILQNSDNGKSHLESLFSDFVHCIMFKTEELAHFGDRTGPHPQVRGVVEGDLLSRAEIEKLSLRGLEYNEL
jgi:hypothetical protein